MASLYELNEKIVTAIEYGCDEDGVILDDAQINELIGDRDEKIENVGLYYKNMKAEAEMYEAEKKAFAEKESIAKNKAESVKKYLENALGGEKYKSGRLSISYRKSEAVKVTDTAKLDDEYLKYSEPTADKTKIKAALKLGEDVPGCELVTNQNIQIK